MQLTRDVARQQAPLTTTRRSITRHRMDQHTDPRGQRSVRTLSQDAGHSAGQHVAGARRRHAGIAAFTQTRDAIRSTYQGPGALQHNRAVITLDQVLECRQAIVLHLVSLYME